jgi:hypothetical protein
VILFELLTGELPFRGSAQMQIHQRLTEDAPDPRKLNRHIPRDLSTICLKCLEREPGRRYSTAASVAEELRRFRRGEPIEARPISKPARLARWARRKPMVATTVALTLFLAIAGPVTALLIERQRARLAELVVEKNNLIERAADKNRRATGQITRLRNQIELWEGRTNPWEFWPPKPDEPPREALLADLLEHSRRTLVGANQNEEYSTAQAARAHFAIALMADALGGTADAGEHYEAALNQLAALLEQNPHNPQIARAIAECHSQLARLVAKTNRAKAAENLKNAAAIYEQLAARDASEPTYSIALLENKLISATLTGFVTGQEHLVRAAELSRTLSERWPKDADAIYRLACYLTGREPILSSPLGSADAAKLTSGITGPSD